MAIATRFEHSTRMTPPAPVAGTASVEANGPVPVAGMTPFTLIDYPHHLSAVLYLQGCPWRCLYCHNADMQPTRSDKALLNWDDVKEFLFERRGFLDAVVFSGGEPTLRDGLARAMSEIKSQGYLVGLHTNGMFPGRVARLVQARLVDWVGLDIKAPRWLYDIVTGAPNASAEPTYRTLRLLLRAGVGLELRTTVYRDFLDDEEIERMARELRDEGADHLKLQACRPREAPDEFIPDEDLNDLQTKVDAVFADAADLYTKRASEFPNPLADIAPAPDPAPVTAAVG